MLESHFDQIDRSASGKWAVYIVFLWLASTEAKANLHSSFRQRSPTTPTKKKKEQKTNVREKEELLELHGICIYIGGTVVLALANASLFIVAPVSCTPCLTPPLLSPFHRSPVTNLAEYKTL